MARLMIVDDDEERLRQLKMLLNIRGHEMESAANGRDALEKARANQPDMIITKIIMPVMDGFCLCHEWKKDETLKNVPFVFCPTEITDANDEPFALSLGAERFIAQPRVLHEFHAIIENLIKEKDEGRLVISQRPSQDELVYLGNYNERLFRNLESKMSQLEKATESFSLEVDEHRETEEAMQQRIDELSSLNRLAERINSSYLSIDEVTSTALEEVVDVPGVDVAFLYFREGDRLLLKALRQETILFDQNEMNIMKVGECLCGLAAQTGTPLYSKDICKDDRCTRAFCKKAGVKSFAALPLFWDSKNQAVMGLASLSAYDFEKSASFLETVVLQISSSLENVFLSENLRNYAKELDRRLAESNRVNQSLHESEERFRQLVEHIREMFYIRDAESLKMLYLSPAFEEIFQRTCESVYQDPFSFMESVHPEDRPRLKQGFEKQLLQGIDGFMEFRIVTPGGETRWIQSKSFPIKDQDGRIRRIVGIAEDITGIKKSENERQMLQMQLAQAQKMEAIGTLAGGIAHDFNNILTATIGYTELALRDVKEGTALYDNLNAVLAAGIRAKDLVQQILTFSRQSETELKPVQAKFVVKEAIRFLRSSLPTTIEIRQDLKSSANILADPTQIYQMMMNLGTNAAHAMQEGGTLTVSLTEITLNSVLVDKHVKLLPGNYLKLSVLDTGHGIAPDVIDRIFEPYFTTKMKGEGTGLGLSVVQGIVNSHHGAITFESVPGTGTRFDVYFPILEKLEVPKMGFQEEISVGSGRILFVDDEPAIVTMIKMMIERFGYEVETCSAAMDALERFSSNPDRFDMVITDLTMPLMTGDKLTEELLKIRPDIAIVLCTGYGEPIKNKRLEDLGIKAFISKPIDMHDLARTISVVLKNKPKTNH